MRRRPVPLAFEILASPIQGLGAFATRRIDEGERIIEYVGDRITHHEADARYDDAAMARHHTFLFTVDEETVIDASVGGNESRFINHSCEPNCEAVLVRGRVFICAIRRIAPGEELTYDYAYEIGGTPDAEDRQRYACHCGAGRCRGTLLAAVDDR